LLPVQEKLEKEVKQLHSVVEAQELKARELARQKYWAEWEDNRPKFVAGLREKVNAKTEARAEKRVVIVEQPEAPRTAPLAETVYPRSPKKPEGLGKMTMELTPERRRENRRELTHEVLLEMSENIEVNGTKLRQIYESGRLDDDGLKQVVLEHLRGGRYEMLLASREIITTERGAEVSADLLPADRRQARQPIIQGAAGPIPSNTATYTPGPAASPSRSPASMVARPFRSMTKQKRTVATAATVGVVSFALLAWLLVSLV
jgi:hypothetical protein